MNGDLGIQVGLRGMVGAGRTGSARVGVGAGAGVQFPTLDGNLQLMIGIEADLELQHRYVGILLAGDAGEGIVAIFFTRKLNCMTVGGKNVVHQMIGKVDVDGLEVLDIPQMITRTMPLGLKNLHLFVMIF